MLSFKGYYIIISIFYVFSQFFRIPESLGSYREHIQRLPRRGGPDAPFLSTAIVSNGSAAASGQHPSAGGGSAQTAASNQASKSLLNRSGEGGKNPA